MGSIEQRLTGGHPNSLGNTIEVVEDILGDHTIFPELFECYFSDDEVVRLRVSNAMKRICKEHKELLIPYVDRLQNEISQIDQASTQWTLAQLYRMLENDLSSEQLAKAKTHLSYNLENHNDWIVLNMTMDTLAHWARDDDKLKQFIRPHLSKLKSDPRKSVAKKATKMLALIA